MAYKSQTFKGIKIVGLRKELHKVHVVVVAEKNRLGKHRSFKGVSYRLNAIGTPESCRHLGKQLQKSGRSIRVVQFGDPDLFYYALYVR